MTASADPTIYGTDKIRAYYRDRLTRYGDAVEAVGWNATNQRRRFELLTHGWAQSGQLLDVGCGRADLWVYLTNGGWSGLYEGVDVVPEMVALARLRTPRCRVLDASTEPLPACDYAVASGVFNLDLGDYGFASADMMYRILTNMWSACSLGMAFDCLDRRREDKIDGQWYAYPADVVGWVQALRPVGMIAQFDTESLHGNVVVQLMKRAS